MDRHIDLKAAIYAQEIAAIWYRRAREGKTQRKYSMTQAAVFSRLARREMGINDNADLFPEPATR